MAGSSHAAAPAKPHRINIHHHLMPPALMGQMKTANAGKPLQFAWTVQRSLDDMAASGTAVSMLSLSLPAVTFLPQDAARHAARASNDYAMTLMADHPGRFGAFATPTRRCSTTTLMRSSETSRNKRK
jgi:predicted TIM-barrel fold metal-dependent hydrolase